MKEGNIDKILQQLIESITEIDFRNYFETDDKKSKLQKKHFLIPVIDNLLLKTNQNEFSLCRKNGMIYLFNGQYWEYVDVDKFKDFLGNISQKSGVDKYDARYYAFKDDLIKQFMSDAGLKEIPSNTKTLVNLRNGTFEISAKEQILRKFEKADFLTYQLPFEFIPNSEAPIFMKFLDQVLPEKELQIVLAEYLGYIFIKNSVLKLEKVMILFGSGANGKSVLFEIISALLGEQNITSYSLSSLTDKNGYYRAMISHKLLNYASEINGRLETSVFKQLCSGEPVEARSPHEKPILIRDYAKLLFNANVLPKEIENTHAYFRRFLIIPFNITIPPEHQDKELAQKIIKNELSGVFNWVLDGLKRLLENKNFSNSEIVKQQVKMYETESDSVLMFLEDEQYFASTMHNKKLKELFQEYKNNCSINNCVPCSEKVFSQKLEKRGFKKKRLSAGFVIYLEKRSI